jgi:hypothetical protein
VSCFETEIKAAGFRRLFLFVIYDIRACLSLPPGVFKPLPVMQRTAESSRPVLPARNEFFHASQGRCPVESRPITAISSLRFWCLTGRLNPLYGT